MSHHEAADQPGGDSPRGVPDVVVLTPLRLEGDPEGTREVLSQEVRGARLERAIVLHQHLEGVRAGCAGELPLLRLAPRDRGHRHPPLHERSVDAEHALRLFFSLLGGRVRRVTLLPEELRGPEEGPGAHLPAHHVAPLVHHGGLRGEPLHVLGLLRQQALGDEHREVGVLVARLLEHIVERALDELPDGVPVRADHHAPTNGRVVGELRLQHDLVVPGREVLLSRGQSALFRHPSMV